MIRIFSLKINFLMTSRIFPKFVNFFKKGMVYGVIFSLSFPHFAWATEAIVELDFKDSQTPQRLHTILPSYKIADVSHIEIDADKQQVVVHKLNKTDDLQPDNDIVPVSSVTTPIILQKHDIINLPWDLEPEKLTLFILNHTAWLMPLDEDSYKLEFRGRLLGGGNTGSTGGGGNNSGDRGGNFGGGNDRVSVRAYCPSNPNWSASGNVPCGNPSVRSESSHNVGRSHGKSGGNDKKGDYGNSRSRNASQTRNPSNIYRSPQHHNIQVNSLSQQFMKQERGFADIKKPFQQNKNEGSIYKGSRYNVEFSLSPLELEACQGKTVCLLSHLKTDTPDVCRVQVVAFKGNVVVGNACSDALPSGKWGYLFTALHFDFKDYDSVWVRPLRTGGKQDSIISAWSYSTWITDIPIKQEETSHVKVVQNSQKTLSFAFPDSPLVYPYFSKDRTTAESFLPSGVTLSSSAITTSKWAKYNYVCKNNIPDSHAHIVESTVYVINHALQEIMQDVSTGDEWDKAEAVSLIRYMTGQHLKRTNSESLENVSKVKGINYVTDYMLPTVIYRNLTEMQKAKEPFDDQVVQDWAKTNWREVAEDAKFMQVESPKDVFYAIKLVAQYGPKGLKLLKQGWQKAVQAYKGELVKGLKIDKSVENKLTQELGKPYLSNNAKGLRWGDTKGNNQVRIMKGREDAQFECQQRDYVQVRRGGQVIGRNQKEVKPTSSFPSPGDNPEAHISYEEWVNWPTLLGE